MELDTFKPMFLILIECKTLFKDINQEITSIVPTNNLGELDALESSTTNCILQFVDNSLFWEGNLIVRF